MFTWIRMFEIVLFSAAVGRGHGSRYGGFTSCEEFEQGAYFDPNEVVHDLWTIFYVWANTTEIYPIMFSLPIKEKIEKFKAQVDAAEPHLKLEWHRSSLIMEARPGLLILFLHLGSPGAFQAVIKKQLYSQVRPNPLPLVKLTEVRLKMVDQMLAMMSCDERTAYAMIREDEVPHTQERCEELAARIGFSGPVKYSYLEIIKLREEL